MLVFYLYRIYFFSTFGKEPSLITPPQPQDSNDDRDSPVTGAPSRKVTVTDESTLKAAVTFQGDEVCHSLEELRRRPVRADERHNFAKQLESILPRALHLQNLEEIDSMVFESGCRDNAPTPAVLKNIAWNSRKKNRRHPNEVLSLEKMVEERIDSGKILQKVLLHPRGVMLWSQRSIRLFHQRCKTDVVYIDATGSIIQKKKGKSAPFYIYELVVRHPIKGASPVPVATYVTCDHTTSSVTYFLESFQTDYYRLFGKTSLRRPVMIMCDGSLVLLQAVSLTFCKVSLGQLLQMYYEVVTGKLRDEELNMPILHRCLSHVMKNAKVFCKKHSPQNYRLSMHVFGLLTSAATLLEMEDILISMAVVFSSPQSGDNVEKHFRNLQSKMLNIDISGDMTDITDEDVEEGFFYSLDMGPKPFQRHFEHIIAEAPVHDEGEPNEYHSATFMPSLVKYFLPQAPLWSALMLDGSGSMCHITKGNISRYTDPIC
ncbi:unnamed protein product [Leuciscus chuanchicus]